MEELNQSTNQHFNKIAKITDSIQMEMGHRGYILGQGTQWSLFTSAFAIVKYTRNPETLFNKFIDLQKYLEGVKQELTGKTADHLIHQLFLEIHSLTSHLKEAIAVNSPATPSPK